MIKCVIIPAYYSISVKMEGSIDYRQTIHEKRHKMGVTRLESYFFIRHSTIKASLIP
ncbi:hypothetical protein [Bartonella massiliensis]|uniref:hypothetical protein n=1 Tax=Bartonella massiliensis TaxID=929795 RepID=UPI00163CCC35|nr:hypothetical protein [Bartonella massiliensis]